MAFRQTLLDIRNDEINLLMGAHDAELLQMLDQVSLDAMRLELYEQAGRLFSSVCAECRIDIGDFAQRHKTFLELKKVHDGAGAARLYRSYPVVTDLLDRMRAVFTGMVVALDITDTAFVFRVSGNLALTQGGTGDAEDYLTHDGPHSE